jgi:hypothetical protein
MDSFYSILYPMNIPDIPSEFHEFHKRVVDMIREVFIMPKKALRGIFKIRVDSVKTDYMIHHGSLDCDGKIYSIVIFWKGSCMRSTAPIDRIRVPYKSDYHLHINVYTNEVPGQSGPASSYPLILKNVANGLMHSMYGGGPKEHIALHAADGSFSMHWKLHETATVVESSRNAFKITGYSYKHTEDVFGRIKAHMEDTQIHHKCNEWVLCKGIHYYFLNYDDAFRSIRTYFCKPEYVFPTTSMVEQAKAREAELFTTFLTGTHGRLGENSVLVKYLSSCVLPLYEVFNEGYIK